MVRGEPQHMYPSHAMQGAAVLPRRPARALMRQSHRQQRRAACRQPLCAAAALPRQLLAALLAALPLASGALLQLTA